MESSGRLSGYSTTCKTANLHHELELHAAFKTDQPCPQSEIWIEADGKELTPRRTLATNEVVNVTRRRCAPEVFEAFYKDYRGTVGHVVTLSVSKLDGIADELRLKIAG